MTEPHPTAPPKTHAEPTTEPARSAALLLAAGASSRMGEPKPLIEWGGRPLVAWECAELLRSGAIATVVVVVGRRAEAVRAALGTLPREIRGRVRYVFNQRWPQGRATSLALGARALRALDPPPEFVLVQNVDQPVPAEVIDDLAGALRAAPEHATAQPTYRGVGAHPVLLRGALLPELCGVEERSFGLRAVIERHPPLAVPMDDRPIVRLDMDTPEAAQEGRAHFAPHGG